MGGCDCTRIRPRNRCARSWQSFTGAGPRTSWSATARTNCWRWRRARLWSQCAASILLAENGRRREANNMSSNTSRRATRSIPCWQRFTARLRMRCYSLCFQRVGYFVGHSELIAALDKIRDSYNVNGLGQVAALATLADLSYYRKNFRRIVATRDRLARELTALGFRVFPSQTNFLLVR